MSRKAVPSAIANANVAETARRKIFRRLIPFLFILYIIAYLDRVNVAFAKLPMSADLGFSEEVFGLGAGIFFLGYIVLQIPGALIVERGSARAWISRIMLTWGLCTILVGFVHSANQFYLARSFLGLAQGGFFPGIIVYLSHWFPKEDRARAIAGFTMSGTTAMVIGAPLSAYIMDLNWFGLQGWRWIFILEGAPAVIFGVIVIFFLTDHPRQAKWLKANEKEWVSSRLEEEKKELRMLGHFSAMRVLFQRNILLLAVACALANLSMFAFLLWLPTTIRNASQFSVTLSTTYSALPFALAMCSIPIVARSSDRTGKRKLHTIVPLILAAFFFLLSSLPGLPFFVVLILLCLTAATAFSWGVSFWAIPSLILGESSAAASVGFINMINSVGSFIGPFIVGSLLTRGFSHREVVWLLASCFLLAAAFVAAVKDKRGVSL